MFLAYFKQDGGCDYTIACGFKMVVLDASSRDEAFAQIKKMCLTKEDEDSELICSNPFTGEEDSICKPEYGFSDALLFEVKELEIIPVEEFEEESEKLQKELEDALQREIDEAELERLKKKLGQ